MVTYGTDRLEIFLNPFSTHVTIKNVSPFSSIEVTNIPGERVFIGKAGETAIVLNIGFLKLGVYFIHIIDSDGQLWVEKIVKN